MMSLFIKIFNVFGALLCGVVSLYNAVSIVADHKEFLNIFVALGIFGLMILLLLNTYYLETEAGDF